MTDSPSPNGSNGRGPDGRFTHGNPGGPGNPNAAHVARLRTTLLEAITPERMKAIAEKLVAQALGGSIPAAREVIERALGKPVETDLLERIERLEQMLAQEKPR